MWFIPTRHQWRGWSLPSKLTAVSAYVAILSVLVTVLLSLWSFQSTPSAEQLDCSSPTQKTIVNGKITVSRPGCYAVDTPNGIPSADLTAIDCKPGDVFTLLAAHDDRTVIIKAWTSASFSLNCRSTTAQSSTVNKETQS